MIHFVLHLVCIGFALIYSPYEFSTIVAYVHFGAIVIWMIITLCLGKSTVKNIILGIFLIGTIIKLHSHVNDEYMLNYRWFIRNEICDKVMMIFKDSNIKTIVYQIFILYEVDNQ